MEWQGKPILVCKPWRRDFPSAAEVESTMVETVFKGSRGEAILYREALKELANFMMDEDCVRLGKFLMDAGIVVTSVTEFTDAEQEESCPDS